MHRKSIYKKFLSQCDNGFIMLDEECCITEVNKAVSDLTGYSRDELEGASLNVLFDNFTSERIYAIYNQFSCVDISHKISGELLQKKGPCRFIEVSINCTCDNDEESFWLQVKNKSFRKSMEDKLRQSELMLNTTLESLPFDFWINDAQNRTYMQNSHSKALWGDVKGSHPDDVGAGEKITSQWIDTTDRALQGEVVSGEIEYIIDGRKKYFRNIIAPIKDNEDLLGILGMNIDITDLKEALETRDMLLKEVHHRVKNNLQMITSIIRLEAANACRDEEEQLVFDDIIHRIDAVSMIHEQLYKTDSNNVMHTAAYIRDLVEHIISGVNIENLDVEYSLEDPETGIDTVITVGLIINELVTNAVKYAFHGDGRHLLKIRLEADSEKTARVSVSDNGPGMPEGFEEDICTSLGFRMMAALSGQLGGKLEWSSSSDGSIFNFTFPLKN